METKTNALGRKPQSRTRNQFILVFMLVVGGYLGLSTLAWVDQHLVSPVLKVSAFGASGLLNLFGVDTVAEGYLVKGKEFKVAVRSGCDPIAPIALMAGAILGFPAPARRKWIGIAVGSILLFVLNLVRVATLFLTGQARSPWFYSLHQEWWPAVFVAVALLFWWAWLNWIRSESTSR